MQKLVLLFSLFLVFSCSQEKMEADDAQTASENKNRIWHQANTFTTTEEWTSDSVRQIRLNLKNSLELHLEATSDAPVYLFFGDELVKKSSAGYLKHSFKNTEDENIYLSLDRDVQEFHFGLYSYDESENGTTYPVLENLNRENRWISDNILLILLLGASLFMVVIKVNYDKRYLSILSFNKVFTTRLNEGDQSRVRVMDQDNLVFAGFYVFVTSGLIYFLTLGREVGFLGIKANGLLEFFQMLAIVSIGLIAKVILISIASNLFGNNKISAFYTKEMLNINLFFIIILFFTSILIYLLLGSIPSFWLSTAIYVLVIFYIIRLILLYFKILKLSSFTNLYLFSYFCTTEIFPFLIGLKYFMR